MRITSQKAWCKQYGILSVQRTLGGNLRRNMFKVYNEWELSAQENVFFAPSIGVSAKTRKRFILFSAIYKPKSILLSKICKQFANQCMQCFCRHPSLTSFPVLAHPLTNKMVSSGQPKLCQAALRSLSKLRFLRIQWCPVSSNTKFVGISCRRKRAQGPGRRDMCLRHSAVLGHTTDNAEGQFQCMCVFSLPLRRVLVLQAQDNWIERDDHKTPHGRCIGSLPIRVISVFQNPSQMEQNSTKLFHVHSEKIPCTIRTTVHFKGISYKKNPDWNYPGMTVLRGRLVTAVA